MATTAQFYRQDALPAPNPTRPGPNLPDPTMDDSAVTDRKKRLLGGRRALRAARPVAFPTVTAVSWRGRYMYIWVCGWVGGFGDERAGGLLDAF